MFKTRSIKTSLPTLITGSRRWAALVALMAMLGLTSLVSAAAASGPVSITFGYSGEPQTWTVPAGVTSATFDVGGAAGGPGYGGPPDEGKENAGGAGGPGARAIATLPVTPGELLTIFVGGLGGRGPNGSWPGGGRGGQRVDGVVWGGGGGGLSQVIQGNQSGHLPVDRTVIMTRLPRRGGRGRVS